MARDLADGVAVGVVGLLDTTVPLVTAARRIEESLERRAMNEPFALGNFQLGAEDVDGWGQARQQRLAPQNATTLHGDAERLVIFSVGLHELSISRLRRGATVRIEAFQDLVTRQTRGHRCNPCHRPMMTPRPRLGCRNETGADRIEREVPSDLQEIIVAIDQQALESTRKDVPHASMPSVERLTVNAVQLSESTGDVGLLRLEEQMVVIPHEAVGVTAKAPTNHDRLEDVQEGVAIEVIEEDRLASVASRQNMEELSRKLKT